MANCTNCNDSILNKQTSVIATPACQSECGTTVDCTGITTYTNCVGVNTALSCSDTTTDNTLTEVLVAMDNKICDLGSDSCTVKISSADTCCGFLEDKIIAGTGVTISKNNTGSCESLTLSVNPSTIVWNDIVLKTDFSTVTGYQIPQYSNPDSLGRVYFRGSFTNSQLTSATLGYQLNVNALPVNTRPLFIRTSFSGTTGNLCAGASGNCFSPIRLNVQPNGLIIVKWNNIILNLKGLFSLDGFFIETN